MLILQYLIVGFITGILGGAFGIGGGSFMIPAFIMLFGLTQHDAQGTSLAVMVPPIFLLSAWRYWAAGHVHIRMAIFVALGCVIGALIGAHFVQGVSDANLKKAFGIFLVLVGIKMFF